MKRKAHPHDHEAELNLIPYLDIMINLVMFMLLSMTSMTSYQVVNVTFPELSDAAGAGTPPPQQPEKEQLSLTVAVSSKGLYVVTKGGALPADLASAGDTADTSAPPTIPCKGAVPCKPDDYDYQALANKLKAIKEYARSSSGLQLAAEPSVKYDALVRVMDASRGDASHPLFPDVIFAGIL